MKQLSGIFMRVMFSLRHIILPVVLLFSASVVWTSCKPIDVYEHNAVIPGYSWKSSYAAKGSFLVSDTASLYKLFVVLRHTDAYQYNNIWLDIGLQGPGDSMYTQKVNLSLGNDAQGWEGSGMNDIWEVRKLLNAMPRAFRKPGVYQYSIRQIMRDDPLTNVMSVGLRLERARQ